MGFISLAVVLWLVTEVMGPKHDPSRWSLFGVPAMTRVVTYFGRKIKNSLR